MTLVSNLGQHDKVLQQIKHLPLAVLKVVPAGAAVVGGAVVETMVVFFAGVVGSVGTEKIMSKH